jgi:hypothetical protein
MATITITWKAFGDPTSATFEWENTEGHDIVERAFRDTNLYNGSLWDALEPHLPENRTHTALSVRDEVEVDGVTWRCEPIGWSVVEQKESV